MVILALLLLIMPVSTASDENGVDYDAYRNKWDLLYEDENDWVCVDFAVNYARNNPGWGMVILSPSPTFRFQPHMTNYKIDGNTLLIHEPQVNRTYELEIVNETMTVPFYEEFPNSFSSQWARGTYFHFIPNESGVVRTYAALRDNRNEFFDYENMSSFDVTNITAEPDAIIDVVVTENNTSAKIDNAIAPNNTTTEDNFVENVDEPQSKSYIERFIQFVKSILVPV